MIAPDLFEFAYVPDWYGQLEELERLALPESWKFRKPSRETKNTVTPILERYIHTIFRKQVIDFNSAESLTTPLIHYTNVSFKELQNTRPFSFLNVQQTAGNQGFFESRQMISIFP